MGTVLVPALESSFASKSYDFIFLDVFKLSLSRNNIVFKGSIRDQGPKSVALRPPMASVSADTW